MPPSPQPRLKPSEYIYQFRIDLQDMPVPVWRRFRVLASETFRNLHYAIHDVMGWKQHYNYRFTPDIKDNPEALIINYFHCPGQICFYDYHDKNGWRHLLTFERALMQKKSNRLPTCINGEGTCPPDNCGGPESYATLVDILTNTSHPDYPGSNRMISRYYPKNQPFDPSIFNMRTVHFHHPETYLSKGY